MYNNFLIGYLIGKNKSSDRIILTPTKETINRHRQILEFIDKNPYCTCHKIAMALNLECYKVNASLIKLQKEKKIEKDIDKYYSLSRREIKL